MARASALHAEGQRFESVILHLEEHNDMMEALRPGTGAEERGKEKQRVEQTSVSSKTRDTRQT